MIERYIVKDGELVKRHKKVYDRLTESDLAIIRTSDNDMNEFIADMIINWLNKGDGIFKNDLDIDKCNSLTVPSCCHDCFALGDNGICGYCKFTFKCYDDESDLLTDNRMPECPFRK